MIHHSIFLFLQTHRNLGYMVIFFAMIIEGDLLLFTAAFLTHRGYFDPLNMLITIFTGTMAGDLFWYWLGMRLNNSPSWVTRWARKIAEPFDEHLKLRPLHTIFLSKFIYGVHHAILIRSGMIRMRLDKYLENDLLSTLFWITIVGGLGFASSVSFDLIRHSIKFVEFSFLGIFILFLIISYSVSNQAKKKL